MPSSALGLNFDAINLKFLQVVGNIVVYNIYKKFRTIPGISEMDLQMWAVVLGDFIFYPQRPAGKM